MENTFNIVSFIELNPIANLTDTYNNRLLTKIKEQFTENQQQLFISSFYTYLHYHPTNDFVIDLDNVWKWLEFSTKQKSKILLEKFFIIEKYYKILINLINKRDKDKHGGQNREPLVIDIKNNTIYIYMPPYMPRVFSAVGKPVG
jgi:hypothetical protein